jgi:hypothetical protein
MSEYDILNDDNNDIIDINSQKDSNSEQSKEKDLEANNIPPEKPKKTNNPTNILSSLFPVVNMYKKNEDNDSVSMSEVYSHNSNDQYVDRLRMELQEYKKANANQSHRYSEMDVSISGSASLCDSDSMSDIDDGSSCLTDRIQSKYKKLTYEEVEMSLNKYQTKEQQLVSEVELLLTFLRGQKHIFKQSNRITIQKYNVLMFPAMFITGGITIMAPFLEELTWSGWALSILNALLTAMIAMNNFMKWQAVAEIYMNISNQYENLMVSIEMTRNQFAFIEDEVKRRAFILSKMKDTENRIMDIKLNFNNVLIPHEIQLHNPIISHVNIFSFIRKIEDYKRGLIMKYKDIKNEISFIMCKWEREESRGNIQQGSNIRKDKEIKRLETLLAKKDKIKNQLVRNNTTNVYTYIDNLFTREIQRSEIYYTFHCVGMYAIFPPDPYKPLKYGNPVVDNYLNFIFTQNFHSETSSDSDYVE